MKYLSHVDTLYLYRKVFTEYDYWQCMDCLPEGCVTLGYANGYEWYDLDYCRIGFMDYDRSLRSKNYPIVVQYNATYLLQTDIKDILLPFGNDTELYLIKRIDFAYTIDISTYGNFNLLEYIAVSKNFKKSSYILGKDRKVETAYLGLRKTGKVFRMYNKSKELSDNKSHLKRQILNSHFGNTSSLVVFEIELHRKYLKDRASISTLAELEKVKNLVASLFYGLKFCKNTPENRKFLEQKNNNHIEFFYPFHEIQDACEFKLNPVKKYEKSKKLLVKNVATLLESYNSDANNTLSYDDLYIALSALQNNDIIKNIEIEYDKENT